MLLNKILLALRKGGTLSYDDLAARADVDRGVVGDAVQRLGRMGYLARYCPDQSSCADCGSCRVSRPGANLWMLTAKGNSYLKEISKY